MDYEINIIYADEIVKYATLKLTSNSLCFVVSLVNLYGKFGEI